MNQKGSTKDIKPVKPLPTCTNFRNKENFVSSEYERQAFQIKKQDEDLQGLGESVQRLGNMGKSINEELVDQGSLLVDVERDIDTTTTRLDFVHKKMELMIVKAGSNKQIFMIVFLICLLVVLIILIFYT